MGRKPLRHLTLHELRMYLEPALSEQRETEIEAHLAGCVACHKKAQNIRRLWAIADSLKFAARRRAKARSAPPAARLPSARSPRDPRQRRVARGAFSDNKP